MSAAIWFVIAVLLLGVELITADLMFGSLAIAGLAAGLVALGTDNWFVQGAVFGVTSLLSLAFLRPAFIRRLHARSGDAATNVDALKGAEATAITDIDGDGGQVKLSGEIWTARSRTGVIASGSKVKVVAIEGATAVVEEKGE